MFGKTMVVVSDAHVRGEVGDETESFLAFLEQVPALGDCLLINGDLFEFWFSYRRAIPQRGFLVAAAIAMLARKIPVAMTGGNHDRWGHDFWRQQANILYSPDELRLEVGSRVVVAAHGDRLPSETRSASITHAVISHPATARVFGLIHPDWGLGLVKRFGPQLADNTTDPAVLQQAQIRQTEWARRRLVRDPTIGLILLSHTHRAAVEELEPGRLILNPGAWLKERSFAIVTERTQELRHG